MTYRIHQRLATKTNKHDVCNLKLHTVHSKLGEEVRHEGVLLETDRVDDDRYGYALEIPVEEFRDVLVRLARLEARFTEEGVLPPHKEPWDLEYLLEDEDE